jgi:hypothetical protein
MEQLRRVLVFTKRASPRTFWQYGNGKCGASLSRIDRTKEATLSALMQLYEDAGVGMGGNSCERMPLTERHNCGRRVPFLLVSRLAFYFLDKKAVWAIYFEEFRVQPDQMQTLTKARF